MRSKILENQVRSGQLSSGHVFGQQATSRPLVWKGRGTQRHSRMCPPLNGRSSHLIEAAKRGRLDQMIFFSAPLTIHKTTAERRLTAVGRRSTSVCRHPSAESFKKF